MKSALASVGKNLILIAVLGVSVYSFFYAGLSSAELLAAQTLAGVLYIFLSCYEFLNASFKASLPVKRFPYFTSSFIMFRALKISIFLALGVMLYASGSRVQYIYPICLIIGFTEGILTYLKYNRSLCFVNVYANYLLLVQNKFTKVFASEIALIEFRHDIFYFVKKNRKTVQIKMEHIRNREQFIQAIHEWIVRNNVNVSAESKTKIKGLITH